MTDDTYLPNTGKSRFMLYSEPDATRIIFEALGLSQVDYQEFLGQMEKRSVGKREKTVKFAPLPLFAQITTSDLNMTV